MAQSLMVPVGTGAVRRGAEGQSLLSWLQWDRGCADGIEAKRILDMHRWRYGSYRPSYLQDGIALPRTADAAAMRRAAA